MPADLLALPVAALPLYDRIEMVFPMDSIVESQMDATAVMGLAAILRRWDPSIQSVTSAVVATDSVEVLARFVTTMPHALQLTIVYPNFLSSEELRRRRWLMLRALLSV